VSLVGHTDEPAEETLRLIYAEVESALARQFDQIQILNGRAQQLLAFAGAALGIVVALRPPGRDVTVAILFGIAVAVFLAIIGLGYRSWSIVGWRRDPDPRRLWIRYRLWPEGWLRQQIVLNWVDAFEQNRLSIDAKVRYLRLTQIVLGAEVGYLVVIVILRPFIA
jgi:hypothetical protein